MTTQIEEDDFLPVNPNHLKPGDLIRIDNYFGLITVLEKHNGVLHYQILGETCFCVNMAIRKCQLVARTTDLDYEEKTKQARDLMAVIQERRRNGGMG